MRSFNFTRILSDTIEGLIRGDDEKGTSNVITHKDHLSKKIRGKKKKTPLIYMEENINKKKKNNELDQKMCDNVIRVKVKMTKQEASRLMSKCKNGGVLEFRDVANQLVDIPINRVSVFSYNSFDSALRTIHEEE